MIENREYWNDIGYKVLDGEFKAGQKIKIERPLENSLETVSKTFNKNEIVKFRACSDYSEEINLIVSNIQEDLKSGLQPDDILVIVLDDRSAKNYLSAIQSRLAFYGIKSNNPVTTCEQLYTTIKECHEKK